MSKLYYEDFAVGRIDELGSVTVTAEEIVEFAREFDPQPFHIDEKAAEGTRYGGLIASGWHTCGIAMRLIAEGLLARSAALGAPGVEECRWLVPVRPGDTLSVRGVVLDMWPSRSKPMGFVRRRYEVRNQKGDLVCTLTGPGMFARRPAEAA